MARSKATKTEQELINAVMFEIDAHKPEIVDNLFPRCSDDYRLEWYNRDVFGFWCHMDGGSRRQVIELAKDRYAVGETSPDREAEKDRESLKVFRAEAAKQRRAMRVMAAIVEGLADGGDLDGDPEAPCSVPRHQIIALRAALGTEDITKEEQERFCEQCEQRPDCEGCEMDS